MLPEQSKLTHCTSASLEIIDKRCLALLQTTAMECTSCDKLFWSGLNRIVILFHPPAQRVMFIIQVSVTWIECVALGLVAFSNIIIFIYSFIHSFIHYYIWHNFWPHFLLSLVLGCITRTASHTVQPSAYNNVATYPLGKYKPAFRAVCKREMIHMDVCTGKEFNWQSQC